jgi:hypothetical protein
VTPFAILDRPGCQRIKAPILPDHKIFYAVFRDMALYLIGECGEQPFQGVPVSDEKA